MNTGEWSLAKILWLDHFPQFTALNCAQDNFGAFRNFNGRL